MGNEASVKSGHRVLEIMRGSPAAELRLIPYLDILIEFNGEPLDNSESHLSKLAPGRRGKRTVVKIFNVKSGTEREAYITPRAWRGPGILGLVCRYDTFVPDEDYLLRVTDLLPNSPAEAAGWHRGDDYILGSETITFRDADVFDEFLESHMHQQVVLYVYNMPTDTVRVSVLVPGEDWTAEDAPGQDTKPWHIIGCGIGAGEAFQFPKVCRMSYGRPASATDWRLFGATCWRRRSSMGTLTHRTINKDKPPPAILPRVIPPQAPEEAAPEDEPATPPKVPARTLKQRPVHSSPPATPERSLDPVSEGSAAAAKASPSPAGKRSPAPAPAAGASGDGEESSETDSTPGRTGRKRGVMTRAAMEAAMRGGRTRRTTGIGTHLMTRGAAKRMSRMAALKAREELVGKSGGASTKATADLMPSRPTEKKAKALNTFTGTNPMMV